MHEPDIKLPDIDFFRVELLTGRTLSNIALRSTSEEKRIRNQANARKAYDAILHFLPSSHLDAEEAAEISIDLSCFAAPVEEDAYQAAVNFVFSGVVLTLESHGEWRS